MAACTKVNFSSTKEGEDSPFFSLAAWENEVTPIHNKKNRPAKSGRLIVFSLTVPILSMHMFVS
jgi:hypothetical protein